MSQEAPKRTPSTSPVQDPKRHVKRPRPNDLWTEDEHREQDDAVKQLLVGNTGRELTVSEMSSILTIIGAVLSEGRHSNLLRVPSVFDYYNAIGADPELGKLIRESHKAGSYKTIRCLELFRKKSPPTPSPHRVVPTYGQEKAAKQSWEREFSGVAAKALWKYIAKHYNNSQDKVYANYTAIVQSSGMGKSRTVDELGKYHFVIPINLRCPDSTGFPPADNDVRDFLAADGSQATIYHRTCAFLEALFDHTAATLRAEFPDSGRDDHGNTEIAARFRTMMTEGQDFQSPNRFRQKFYQDVIQNADDNFHASRHDLKSPPAYASTSGKEITYDFPPARACENLVDFLRGDHQSSPTSQGKTPHTKASDRAKNDRPLIVLTFDEAHTLTRQKTTTSTQWSNFSELQYVLRGLHRLPCFSLFMSTTGKISQFTSAPEEDASFRILSGELKLIQPFTDLGFDTLARKVSLSKGLDLGDLTSNEFIAHFGRPLFGSLYDAGDKAVRERIVTFARAKLLNAQPQTVEDFTDHQKLACLSQRIPLEFYSTTYVAQGNERTQVEGHMRVCLEIDATFESMVTVSASEPLLSEAAYTIMSRPSFDVPKAMKSVLQGFSIDKGDRGEFLVMLLLTIARDKTVGQAGSRVVGLAPFLAEQLFQNHKVLRVLFEDFPNSKMHFNHYVKVHEYAAIDAESLLLLFSRGAGILCANNQYAIDGINPFLYNGPKLSMGNFGLILWQSKNDSAFTHEPRPELFGAMDVYKLKILKEGAPAIPLIKIVFALAAKDPSLSVTRRPPSSDYNAIIYEIWCAGISPDIFTAVERSQAGIWAGLLRASCGWGSIYQGPNVDEGLRRSMNPGAGCDMGHWKRWVERSSDEN